MSKIINLNSYISESFIHINEKSTIIVKNDNNHEFDVYFNSHKISFKNNNDSTQSIEGVEPGHIRIYIDPTYKHNIEFYINVTKDNDLDENLDASYKCVYTPSIINISNVNSNSINDNKSSYMMIRTNPKLTGNIKLVVNSENNLYLDTFPINSELSQLKYRKREVGIDSYYSNDVRNVFNSISSDSLYSIPDNGDNLKLKIDNQFIDTYNYGVKLNTNRLYNENFSFLAPLWINNDLPDYFVIFKVENFRDNISSNATDRLKYCIKNGKIVKYFDIKRNSKLGKYLRNHQSEINNYMSSVYISNNDDECNSWYGVSIDSGIITNKYEDLYEINKIESQVKYDNFLTLGYERNRLLNPYLINIEFMFDDINSSNFSINQYIGFYLYNHEFKSIYKVDNIKYDTNFNITSNNILPENTNNSNTLENRIFNISIDTINNNSLFYRFTSNNDIDNILSNLDNIPYKNVLSCPINNSTKIQNHPQFITLTFNEPIQIGEHLRIVDKNDQYDNTGLYGEIYEVISSMHKSNEVGIVYSNDNKIKCTYSTFTGYDECNINDKNAIIKNQIIEIVNAFNSMDNLPFKISTYSDKSISFMAIDAANMLTFERITNEIIYDIDNNVLNETANDNVITYFNDFIIPGSILHIESTHINNDKTLLYSPINFEVWNDRKIYIVNFTNYNVNNVNTNTIINSGNLYSYSIDKKYIINKLDKECLVTSDNGYIKLYNFPISYSLLNYENNNTTLNVIGYSANACNVIISPYNNNEYILQTQEKAKINNGILNIYSLAQIHFNIAGITPVKDFAFNVLDSNNTIKSLINTSTEYSNDFSDESVITIECKADEMISLDINTLYKVKSGKFRIGGTSYVIGQYIPFGTNSIIGETEHNVLIPYSNVNYDNYFYIQPRVDKNYSFERLNDYIENKNDIYKSNIPLITPIQCKWRINGIDIFGNNIKKVNNTDIDVFYNDVSVLGYSSFKYTNDNQLYVYNNVNDIVGDDKLINHIINGNLPISSIFSNDVYKNNKFSILYYNKDTDSLETIFGGKKINLKISKLLDISLYNGYMFSIINSPCSHRSENETEMLISDKERICLIINYKNAKSGLETYKNNYTIDNIYNENENMPTMELPFSILNSDVYLTDVVNNKYIPISNEFSIDSSNINMFIAAISDNNDIYKKSSYTYEINNVSKNNITKYYIDTSDADIIKSIDNSLNITEDKLIEKTYNNVYEYILGDVQVKIDNTGIAKNTIYLIDKSLKYPYDISINYTNLNNNSLSCYINPEFTDIISFKNVEDNNVNTITKLSLISSNTNINNVNTIKQLWINKHYNSNNMDNINDEYAIDCIFNYNPLLTEWDDVLRIYNDTLYRSDKGYKLNNTCKLFFGSVAPVLNDEYIELKKWDDISITNINREYTAYNNEIKRYNIKIDLTEALYSYIKNETQFINSNWGTTTYDNINEYIKNMISYYYIINNKNIINVFRCYSSNISEGNKFISFDDSVSYELCNNITFNVILEDNNHYYLTFELPIDNYQYTLKYKIMK